MTGEAVDYVGDVDTYTVSGTAGEEIEVLLQGLNGRDLLQVQLDLFAPAGNAKIVEMAAEGNKQLLEDTRSNRLRLPETGTYRIEVSRYPAYNVNENGPYRFQVRRLQ